MTRASVDAWRMRLQMNHDAKSASCSFDYDLLTCLLTHAIPFTSFSAFVSACDILVLFWIVMPDYPAVEGLHQRQPS